MHRGLRHSLLSVWLLAGCTVAGQTAPPGTLISHTLLARGQEQIVVSGGGRDIRSLVLLPDGWKPGQPHQLLLAVHNFGGDAAGFAGLIHADRLTQDGILVVVPQALGTISEWQGPGITITALDVDPAGRRIDDAAGLVQVARQAAQLYSPTEIDLLGFSQGATVALDVARRMDWQQQGAVRWLFLAAGSVAGPIRPSLGLPGTDIIDYQPGRNGMQDIANFSTGEPGAAVFLPEIATAKRCQLASQDTGPRVDTRHFQCQDGHTLTTLYEKLGEHAWPGQDAKYDSALMGAGSGSAVDFTTLIARALHEPNPADQRR